MIEYKRKCCGNCAYYVYWSHMCGGRNVGTNPLAVRCGNYEPVNDSNMCSRVSAWKHYVECIREKSESD